MYFSLVFMRTYHLSPKEELKFWLPWTHNTLNLYQEKFKMSTTIIQEAKSVVRSFYDELDKSGDGGSGCGVEDVMKNYCAESYSWRGFYPLEELSCVREVCEKLWRPLHRSFKNIQRRQDVFMAGKI